MILHTWIHASHYSQQVTLSEEIIQFKGKNWFNGGYACYIIQRKNDQLKYGGNAFQKSWWWTTIKILWKIPQKGPSSRCGSDYCHQCYGQAFFCQVCYLQGKIIYPSIGNTGFFDTTITRHLCCEQAFAHQFYYAVVNINQVKTTAILKALVLTLLWMKSQFIHR